jgi:hypothetical protein
VVISIKFSLEVLSLNCILLHSFGFKLLKGKIGIENPKGYHADHLVGVVLLQWLLKYPAYHF